MKYHVNENCIGCGLCTSICPEFFSMGDEGMAVAAEGDVSQNQGVAEEAKNSCPVEAIEEA